jgi:hypothetical protein
MTLIFRLLGFGQATATSFYLPTRDATLSTSTNAGTGDVSVTAGRDIFLRLHDLTSGLVGHWKFDEGAGTTAGDSAGSNNGTLFGDTAWSTENPFRSSGSYSLDFDGAGDYVLTTQDIKSLFPDESLTIGTWFYAYDDGVIISELGQQTINANWHDSQIEILDNGDVRVRVWQLGSVNLGNVNFGEWNHAVIRYDDITNTLDGFLNGVEASGNTTGDRQTPWSNFTAPNNNLYYGIGAQDSTNLGSGKYMNGLIDDTRIYNIALSASDVTQVYAYSPHWNSGITTFSAGRDVSLGIGTAITATDSGNALIINAGRNFINNAGAGALDTSHASGRYLVYSTDPAGNTLGGLTPDFKRYNKTYAGYAPGSVSETGDGFLYSIAPTLTVTANNATRVYGDANAFTASITGFIDGDSAGTAVSGAASYSGAAQSSNVGSYTITPSLGTLASDLGYQFSTFNSGALSITQAPLSVSLSPIAYTRAYGAANPNYTLSYSGFKLGETFSVLDMQPYVTTAANVSSPTGLYMLNLSGGEDNNYSFIYTTPAGSLSIAGTPDLGTNLQTYVAMNLGGENGNTAAAQGSLAFGMLDVSGGSFTPGGSAISAVIGDAPNKGQGDDWSTPILESVF